MLSTTVLIAPLAVVPQGSTGVEEFAIGEVHIALARVEEVAHVTPGTAPELLMTFNKAYIRADEVVCWLQKEYLRAEREQDRIRAIIVLDRAPEILQKKGLTSARSPAGSEDLRQAVVDSDPDYQKACETAATLRALMELMRGKKDGLEMAYNSVKRLLSEQAFNFASVGVRAGNEGNAGIGDVVIERPQGPRSQVAGVGRARP